MSISAEKTFQGAWRFSTIKNGHLFTRQYMGYSKRDALVEFKEELKS